VAEAATAESTADMGSRAIVLSASCGPKYNDLAKQFDEDDMSENDATDYKRLRLIALVT
jgi:hypothetical protein